MSQSAAAGEVSPLPSSNLDPEPFSCYAAIVLNPEDPLEDMKYERREVQRHARCHEGDVHFNPRPEYVQDEDKYPSDIWSDD